MTKPIDHQVIQQLREQVRRARCGQCAACHGKGYQLIGAFGSSRMVSCWHCRGTGRKRTP